MNRRAMLFLMLIVFTIVSSAYGQDFYLKSISKNKQTAVVGEKGTDMKWTVEEGDKIKNGTSSRLNRGM